MKTRTKKDLCDIKRTIKGQSVVDGAGVKINRIIGSYHLEDIDPFVLLDEIKSDDPDDYIAGFPMHPHRGIETITYMVKGNFRHKDSRGGGGLLSDGCVQWMTAGKGIQHSEMPETNDDGLWGFQLWLNLPKRHKWVEPRYQHLSPEMIPSVDREGISVKVISGTYEGTHGPAKNWVESDYFDVTLDNDALFRFEKDPGMSSFCYVREGSFSVNGTVVHEHELAEFDHNAIVEIKGDSEKAAFLFIAGYPNNEPIVRGGPFVMNTEEEIYQAFEDYRNGILF
jgi:redox-sensitive bicupin YhaK (pirin superfamily)